MSKPNVKRVCLECERCHGYFHTTDPVTDPCKCIEYEIPYREFVNKTYRDVPEFSGEPVVAKVWAKHYREALDKLLSDRFFRDGNSLHNWEIFVEMTYKNSTYIGKANMKYCPSIRLRK